MIGRFLRKLFFGTPRGTLPESNERTLMVRGITRRYVRDDASSPWRAAKLDDVPPYVPPPWPTDPALPGAGNAAQPTVLRRGSDDVTYDELVAAAEKFAEQGTPVKTDFNLPHIQFAKHPNLSSPALADLRFFVWRRGTRGPEACLQAQNPTAAMDYDVGKQRIIVVHNVTDEELGIDLEEMVRRHPCPKVDSQ